MRNVKKNDSKADPILGFKFWTPKWEPGKKKWKPDPILGSKIWTQKWGQPPGSICRHLLSEFHRRLTRERFKTCFQPARSPTQTVATCWAAAIINACAGLWMEHRRNQRNAKCKKKWFKGWPHFGVQILDPKMGTRKEKMKAWPHFGVQNLDPKMGSATRVDLPAFVVWISPAAYAWTF